MSKYTFDIFDTLTIYCDGEPMTTVEVLQALQQRDALLHLLDSEARLQQELAKEQARNQRMTVAIRQWYNTHCQELKENADETQVDS